MKKLIAILLVCLLAAVAAAETVEELNWADVSAELGGSGTNESFATYPETSLVVWIPADLEAEELTDDDRTNGYIGYYSNADQSLLLAVVRVQLSDMTFDDYVEKISGDETLENVARLTVNGLPAVSYYMPENDSLNISVADGTDYAVEVTMAPGSAEGNDGIWKLISASVQSR